MNHLAGDTTAGNNPGISNSTTSTDTTLHAENILLKAFELASESASQSYTARDNTANLFLLLVGALATGLGALFQLGSNFRNLLLPSSAFILFAASLLSVTLFVRYLSTRSTYIESLISANLIIEYYLQHLEPVMPDLGDAFRWRLSNIPTLRRVGPIMLYPMALCGSICFSASLFIAANLLVAALPREVLGILSSPFVSAGIALVALVLTLLLQMSYYVAVFRQQGRALDILSSKIRRRAGVAD